MPCGRCLELERQIKDLQTLLGQRVAARIRNRLQTALGLTPQQTLLLEALRQAGGERLSARQLADAIFSLDRRGGPEDPVALVRVCISRIRSAQGAAFISGGGVKGGGYWLSDETISRLEGIINDRS